MNNLIQNIIAVARASEQKLTNKTFTVCTKVDSLVFHLEEDQPDLDQALKMIKEVQYHANILKSYLS